MGYMSNAIIELAEAGAVPADPAEVRAWRAAGHTVPLVWVPVDTYRGRQRVPAISLETAERLVVALDDETARAGLRQALDDANGCLPAHRRRGRKPTRMVCYDEGDGEWTIEVTDEDGVCVVDSRGEQLAMWLNHEGDEEFKPLSLAGALAKAAAEFADVVGRGDLAAYVHRGGKTLPVCVHRDGRIEVAGS